MEDFISRGVAGKSMPTKTASDTPEINASLRKPEVAEESNLYKLSRCRYDECLELIDLSTKKIDSIQFALLNMIFSFRGIYSLQN